MSETIIEVEALPLVLDDVIIQGATWRRTYVYLPGGVASTDFLQWGARMQIRGKTADAEGELDPRLELSTELGGITLGDDGSIFIVATAEQTQSLTKGGKYDLELYMPNNGDTIRFLMGFMSLSKEVTR